MGNTNISGLKKLRCKKEYGVWYYEKEQLWDLDFPTWALYNANGEHQYNFGCYDDMKYYVETGIII